MKKVPHDPGQRRKHHCPCDGSRGGFCNADTAYTFPELFEPEGAEKL